MPIFKKINEVMKAVRGVDKGSTNKGAGGYKYAGHEAVTEVLRGHFADLGIVRSATQLELSVLDGATVQMKVEVRYTDVDDDSSVSFISYALQPSQTSNKTLTAQQVGQALSYAVKNVEFKLFALTGDPEPDSDEADTRGPASDEEPREDLASAHTLAKALLNGYTDATTVEHVQRVSAAIKADWAKLSCVPNLAEAITACRATAMKRIKEAAAT